MVVVAAAVAAVVAVAVAVVAVVAVAVVAVAVVAVAVAVVAVAVVAVAVVAVAVGGGGGGDAAAWSGKITESTTGLAHRDCNTSTPLAPAPRALTSLRRPSFFLDSASDTVVLSGSVSET